MKHLLIVALCALPLSAFAGPKEDAKPHVDKAAEAHQQGKFDIALSELEAAYKIDPQPDLLYAIGQVHVKLGHCDAAIAAYERFLATKPPAEPSVAANEAIKTCKAQQASTTPPPPPPPQEEPAPPPEPLPAPPPAETATVKVDAVGSTLLGLGIASTIAAVFMYSNAINTLDDAEQSPTHEAHDKAVEDAEGMRNTAVIFGVVGAAVITMGVFRYVQVRKDANTSVGVAPTQGGGAVTWMGRF